MKTLKTVEQYLSYLERVTFGPLLGDFCLGDVCLYLGLCLGGFCHGGAHEIIT